MANTPYRGQQRPQQRTQQQQGNQQQGATARPLPQQALAPRIQNLPPARTYTDVEQLTEDLRAIADKAFLLTPSVKPDHVPEFHSISVRYVLVDADANNNEVYKGQGFKADEVALTRVTLDRIAGCAGVTWDPVRSRRLDDGSNAHYCHFRTVGAVRDLDGSIRTLVAEKEIDLRDGNPNIFTDDEARMKKENGQVINRGFVWGWSAERLAGAREHIVAMCESKARNRVVRMLGVKHKYRIEELRVKPFVVLRLVLTGRSDDPELEKEARRLIMRRSIELSTSLYGEPIAAAPLPAALPPPEEPHAPPPIAGASDPDADEPPAIADVDLGDVVNAEELKKKEAALAAGEGQPATDTGQGELGLGARPAEGEWEHE